MTRDQKSRERRSFLLTLATELESHLENGSDFIYLDNAGEDDAPEDVVGVRVVTLKRLVASLRRRACRG